MVRFVGGLYICSDCRLQYRQKRIAEKCERWCLAHHSCNLAITKFAVK